MLSSVEAEEVERQERGGDLPRLHLSPFALESPPQNIASVNTSMMMMMMTMTMSMATTKTTMTMTMTMPMTTSDSDYPPGLVPRAF